MSSLGRLRLITFDVTNTLLQFRSSPGKQYGEIGALFGVRCDNNDLVTNFKSNWCVTFEFSVNTRIKQFVNTNIITFVKVKDPFRIRFPWANQLRVCCVVIRCYFHNILVK